MGLGDLWGSTPQRIETAAKHVGDYFRREGFGANDGVTLFTVLAVRCARLAGATKEQYLNYVAQMYDDKSQDPGAKERSPLIF